MIDIWNNGFEEDNEKAPFEIIKEYIDIFYEKTNKNLELEITFHSGDKITIDQIFSSSKNIMLKSEIRYNLTLQSHNLPDYKFGIMEIWSGISLYPAYIKIDTDIADEMKFPIVDDFDYNFSVNNENEFRSNLEKILSSKKFTRTVVGLLKLVQAKKIQRA